MPELKAHNTGCVTCKQADTGLRRDCGTTVCAQHETHIVSIVFLSQAGTRMPDGMLRIGSTIGCRAGATDCNGSSLSAPTQFDVSTIIIQHLQLDSLHHQHQSALALILSRLKDKPTHSNFWTFVNHYTRLLQQRRGWSAVRACGADLE